MAMTLKMRISLKAIILLIFTSGGLLSTFAQEGLNVYHTSDANGNVKFYCNNDNHFDYTVEVDFRTLVNYDFQGKLPYEGIAHPGRNFLFSLRAGDPNKQSSLLYNSYFYKGCKNPEIDQGFSYLLPISTGQATEPILLDYLKINESDRAPKDYYALGFVVNPGDTIFAARRGVVSELRDTSELAYSDYIYSSDDNYLEIFHQDCTFGRYEVFEESLITLGQHVEAGDPIAIAGGEHYSAGSHMRFSVTYVHQKTNEAKKERINSWAYVPLFFCTAENEKAPLIYGQKYTCVKPEAVITQELSKRELKKWKK